MTSSQPLFSSRVAKLFLASSAFFVAVGPGVGALVFFPIIGPVAVMAGYPFGVLPALLAGVLNALVLAVRAGGMPSVIRARWIHALAGGLCGTVGIIVLLAIVDGPWLGTQVSSWYDFWHTINRLEYPRLSVAGLLVGAVCGVIFNPIGERLLQSKPWLYRVRADLGT